MATSTCGACKNTTWEAKPADGSGINRSIFFIQCAKCGVPVGVVEEPDPKFVSKAIQDAIAKQNAAIKMISDRF